MSLDKLVLYSAPRINSGRQMYDRASVDALVATMENAQRLGQFRIERLQNEKLDLLQSCTNQRRSLEHQSTMLAEALQAKDEALKCKARLPGLERRLTELECARDEADLLRAELAGVRADRDKALEDAKNKLNVINILNTALAKYKPPEAKFRVGQVVVADERRQFGETLLYKIAEVEWRENKYWYWSHLKGHPSRVFYHEVSLRGLNDEER